MNAVLPLRIRGAGMPEQGSSEAVVSEAHRQVFYGCV
jgi:hypothetical protein